MKQVLFYFIDDEQGLGWGGSALHAAGWRRSFFWNHCHAKKSCRVDCTSRPTDSHLSCHLHLGCCSSSIHTFLASTNHYMHNLVKLLRYQYRVTDPTVSLPRSHCSASMDASTPSSSSVPGTSFVILSVSIVGILATALLLLSYYLLLTRCGLLFFWRSDHLHHIDIVAREQEPPPPPHCRGLQAAAIRRVPTFRYRSSNNQEDKSDCAVCLADFRHGERLRLLPPCRHAFHIDCIDAWLQATANCPLCRATVPAETGADRDILIQISPSSSEPQPSPAAEEPCQHHHHHQPVRSRRSLSMDSSTDKRFYLALQRMLHHQHQDHQQLPEEEEDAKSPAASRSRSLRRSFFSFSHTRSATILPL